MDVKRNLFGLLPFTLVQGMFSVALLWLTRNVQSHVGRAFMRRYTFLSIPKHRPPTGDYSRQTGDFCLHCITVLPFVNISSIIGHSDIQFCAITKLKHF
jgi:hypothetical protein